MSPIESGIFFGGSWDYVEQLPEEFSFQKILPPGTCSLTVLGVKLPIIIVGVKIGSSTIMGVICSSVIVGVKIGSSAIVHPFTKVEMHKLLSRS